MNFMESALKTFMVFVEKMWYDEKRGNSKNNVKEARKMIANYHTHTVRCQHAVGEEREYIETAIRSGLKILGFSDHTPMPYSGGYVSTVRMRVDQLEDYVTTILNLKKEYARDIEIYLGLETEYYPAYFDHLLEILSPYPMDYLLLGQHNLGNEINDVVVFDATPSPELLQRYCSQVIEAMETGCFSYVAHPDVMNYVGDPVIYEEKMRTVCEKAKELQIPLEINLLGLWGHRHYPNDHFWKVAGEVGNDVIFGSDAHEPKRVYNLPAIEEAEKLVQKYGLKKIDTITFRAPRR